MSRPLSWLCFLGSRDEATKGPWNHYGCRKRIEKSLQARERSVNGTEKANHLKVSLCGGLWFIQVCKERDYFNGIFSYDLCGTDLEIGAYHF